MDATTPTSTPTPTALARVVVGIDAYSDTAQFEHVQRVATMFSKSELIPPHLRGKLADVAIALLMARRMEEDPLVVMQSIYVVSGRAGWAATYVIARANKSGIFRGRIGWRIAGFGDSLAITAYAVLADTGEEVSFTASMAMASAEGWVKNPKYHSMPELMLRYRSAVLLVRLYAPEVMLGYHSSDELEDVRAARGQVIDVDPLPTAAPASWSAEVEREATRREAAPATSSPSQSPPPPPPAAIPAEDKAAAIERARLRAACEAAEVRLELHGELGKAAIRETRSELTIRADVGLASLKLGARTFGAYLAALELAERGLRDAAAEAADASEHESPPVPEGF